MLEFCLPDMIRMAENYILVEIEKKFQDKQGNIVIDPTWTPEEYATIEGIVINPPIRIKSDAQRSITGNVFKGDKIFFSFATIFDYLAQPGDDTFVYRNLVLYEGKEYWRVHAGEVFCRVDLSGRYEMITDNILIEPGSTEETGIVKAMPTNINLSCKPNDLVCFDPRFVQKYNIFNKEHYILPTRRIIAKLWT